MEPELPNQIGSPSKRWPIRLIVAVVGTAILSFGGLALYHQASPVAPIGSNKTPKARNGQLHYFTVSSGSMEPTLIKGEKYPFLPFPIAGASSQPQSQSIIIYRDPVQPSLIFASRIVAMPGERVVIQNGGVKVYTHVMPAGFDPDSVHRVLGSSTEGTVDTIVRPNSYFVLGDNRQPESSYDSRSEGLIPVNNVLGMLVVRSVPN